MSEHINPSNSRKYLTPEEACRYLGLSLSTLAKKRMWGTGPRYRKFGRRVAYTVDDLDAWADAQVRTSTSENGAGGDGNG